MKENDIKSEFTSYIEEHGIFYNETEVHHKISNLDKYCKPVQSLLRTINFPETIHRVPGRTEHRIKVKELPTKFHNLVKQNLESIFEGKYTLKKDYSFNIKGYDFIIESWSSDMSELDLIL